MNDSGDRARALLQGPVQFTHCALNVTELKTAAVIIERFRTALAEAAARMAHGETSTSFQIPNGVDTSGQEPITQIFRETVPAEAIYLFGSRA